MLTRRLLAALAGGALALIVASGPAMADPPIGDCDDVGQDCEVVGGNPADPGGGDHDGGNGGGGSEGCSWKGETVPCDGGELGWFNNSDGCYYKRIPPPPGDPHNGQGGWYVRTCGVVGDGPVISYPATWYATPPAGPDPEELARRALARITLKGADIGMAPRPGSAGLVNLPVWMWTEVTPNTWGPITSSASAGGLTVTITAKAERIVWNMGDGKTVTCTNPGTPFKTGDGGKKSPTCGHIYLKPSRDRAGDQYQVTATTDWRVDWSGGGVSGVIDQTRTAQTTVQIDELQVVNR